jgi:adenylate cyclase
MMSLCETGFVGRVRHLVGWIPSGPRCRFCQVPFSGFGKLLHIKPSPKNQNYCRSCFEALPDDTIQVEAGVLFADMRGFTAFSECHTAAEASKKLARFYSIAEKVLARHDTLIEFVGDQVMALFLPVMNLKGPIPEDMLDAAQQLVSKMREDKEALPVGVGLNFGTCEVGNVVKGESKDFTAVGDVVNTAARLQGCANAYEIVLSESIYTVVESLAGDAQVASFALKGKAKPVTAYVIPPS